MYIIRAGRRWLNLEHLILAEQGEDCGPFRPGTIRVTMETGATFDLSGAAAEEFRRGADSAVVPLPSNAGVASLVVRVDTETGAVLPAALGEREERG